MKQYHIGTNCLPDILHTMKFFKKILLMTVYAGLKIADFMEYIINKNNIWLYCKICMKVMLLIRTSVHDF